MSLVDGIGLIVWKGCLFDPSMDLLARVKWVDQEFAAAGATIIWNEAGRPFGVPSDRYARNSIDTASGLSTVWFQWGRYERGETPSAANPALGVFASDHTRGIAIDCNAPTSGDADLRLVKMRAVGMIQTIGSETWHFAERYPVTVDLTALAGYTVTPLPSTQTEEDIIMASIDDLIAALHADDSTKGATIVRNYVKENTTGSVATALIYPDGTAVKLNETEDVDGATVAFAIVYGLQPTNASFQAPRDRYGSQLTNEQWAAFWKAYPGKKVGFDATGL